MRCRRLVRGVRSIGSTDTTIGNSLIALTVTAIAASTTVAPEPSVEIRMIWAGPAQTNAVLSNTHPRVKPLSCASAPMPRYVANSTRVRTVDVIARRPRANDRAGLFHSTASGAGGGTTTLTTRKADAA